MASLLCLGTNKCIYKCFSLVPLIDRAQGVFAAPGNPLGFWEGVGCWLLFNHPTLYPGSFICKLTEVCEEFESSLSQLLSAHKTRGRQLRKGIILGDGE